MEIVNNFRKEVVISRKNSKMGVIPSVSVTPILSCGNCTQCREYCYALDSYTTYPTVAPAWDSNLLLYLTDPDAYFESISAWISKARHLPFFRWHVAGDIIDEDYFNGMRSLAIRHPATRFLAFTKMYALTNCLLPENLTVVWSAWPGVELPVNGWDRSVAYCRFPDSDVFIPESARECPGKCDSCGTCWTLSSVHRDVVFDIHGNARYRKLDFEAIFKHLEGTRLQSLREEMV